MKINLLWADDDCNRFLLPLGRIIDKDPRFNLTKATNYLEALNYLETSQGAPNTLIRALLADIILPYDIEGRGALISDLGIKLANRAASLGVRAVAFLTVVRRDEVADKFIELQDSHSHVNFTYFDKTDLLSRNELQNLLDALSDSDHAQ
ncbi:MAG TPA: hypothetical protein VEY11_07150 [Pyrinomonadaceae bacterium]|nr:hypothetical protein [Pyrinomonadaceae bacterium]